MTCLVLIAYLFSNNRKKINWKTAFLGLFTQLILAILIIRVEFVQNIFEFFGKIFVKTLAIILTTHYLEEAEMLCRNVGIINQGKIVTDGAIRDLLRDLNSETFLLDTQEELPSGISIPGYQVRQVEPQCLEVEIEKGQELAQVFTALGELGVSVVSMRNKENRLERMFVNVLEGAS